MGEGFQIAIPDAENADLIRLECALKKARLAAGKLRPQGFAGWRCDIRHARIVTHGLAADGKRAAIARGSERLFFQFRFLHQPMGNAAIEGGIGATALKTARP